MRHKIIATISEVVRGARSRVLPVTILLFSMIGVMLSLAYVVYNHYTQVVALVGNDEELVVTLTGAAFCLGTWLMAFLVIICCLIQVSSTKSP